MSMFPLLLAAESHRRQWWNFLPLSLCPPASLIPPPPFCSLNSRFLFWAQYSFLLWPSSFSATPAPGALFSIIWYFISFYFYFLLEECVSDSVDGGREVQGYDSYSQDSFNDCGTQSQKKLLKLKYHCQLFSCRCWLIFTFLDKKCNLVNLCTYE